MTQNRITIQTVNYVIGCRPCPLPVFVYFAAFRKEKEIRKYIIYSFIRKNANWKTMAEHNVNNNM